jgi:hypothetical protein
MQPECERWAAWFDAKALEEPTSHAQTLWAEQHQLSCAHCASEARFFSSMLQPAHVATSPAALALAQHVLSRAEAPRRWRRLALAGLAAAAALVFGVFWLGSGQPKLSLTVVAASGAMGKRCTRAPGSSRPSAR